MVQSGPIVAPRFIAAATPEEFSCLTRKAVLDSVAASLRSHGECRLGLAGGSTPAGLYAELAKEPLPWDRIVLVSIDERCVPPSDPQSNAGMIRRQLADRVELPAKNLVLFDTKVDAKTALGRMEHKIIELANRRLPVFDLLILGAGADGHVASLFPGSPALESNEFAAETISPAKDRRLTLTFRTLCSAAEVIVLLLGNAKQPLFERIRVYAPAQNTVPVERIIHAVPATVLFSL